MKKKLLVLCLLSLNVVSLSAQGVNNLSDADSCQFNGKTYAIGSKIRDQDASTLTCKTYDAIIPKTADRLLKGYAYWEKKTPGNSASIELPRTLLAGPQTHQ